MSALATLVACHSAKTGATQRLAEWVDGPDFPFPAEDEQGPKNNAGQESLGRRCRWMWGGAV